MPNGHERLKKNHPHKTFRIRYTIRDAKTNETKEVRPGNTRCPFKVSSTPPGGSNNTRRRKEKIRQELRKCFCITRQKVLETTPQAACRLRNAFRKGQEDLMFYAPPESFWFTCEISLSLFSPSYSTPWSWWAFSSFLLWPFPPHTSNKVRGHREKK